MWGKVDGYDNYICMEFNGIPYRFDEETGALICYCSDPICDHMVTTCPFWGNSGNCIYYNNSIYYIKLQFDQKSKHDKMYVSYDIEDKELHQLRGGNFGYNISTQVYYNNYCYFYEIDVDEENGEWTVFLKRQNLDTYDIELLETTAGFNTMILFGNEDKLYFVDNMFGVIYYTPVDDLTNKTIIYNSVTDEYMTDGENIFFIEYCKDGRRTISSIGYDGTNYKDYGLSNVWRYYVTNKYIYYMTDETCPIEIDDDTFTLTSRYLFRYDKETQKSEKVLSFDDVLQTISIERFIVCGNYLYASFDFYSDGVSYNTCGNSIIRIDIKSGDWYYIDPLKTTDG